MQPDEGRADVRVLLADDHPVVLSGLGALLESISGVSVVGQVSPVMMVLP